jgi:flagellar hook-length control protein FliK
MPESLTMPVRAPTPPAADVGVTPGSGAADTGAFEDMLQAGLAGRTDPDGGTPMLAIPVSAKSAAKSTENSDASGDGTNRQPANGEDTESTSLTALLAYSAGVIATILPVTNSSLPGPADSVAALATSPPDAATASPASVQPLERPLPQMAPVTLSDARADPSSAAAMVRAQTVRPAAGFSLAKDPTTPAGSDEATPRTGIVDSPTTLRALSGPAEAAKNAPDNRTDGRTDNRPAKEGRPARREDLRSPADTVVADVARQREDLMNAVQPAHESQPDERPADRSSDIAARIDTIDAKVRTDMTPRLDSLPVAAPERAAPVPVVYVEQGLGSAGWKQEFGSQLTLLVSRREPQAEIRLNPPQLGPVEIRIGLQGDQVSLAFTAPHPDTRAAIENALPQLREMFAGNGLALCNASVNAESSQQQSHRGTHQNRVSFPNQEPMVAESMPPIRRVAVRLVDTFA